MKLPKLNLMAYGKFAAGAAGGKIATGFIMKAIPASVDTKIVGAGLVLAGGYIGTMKGKTSEFTSPAGAVIASEGVNILLKAFNVTLPGMGGIGADYYMGEPGSPDQNFFMGVPGVVESGNFQVV